MPDDADLAGRAAERWTPVAAGAVATATGATAAGATAAGVGAAGVGAAGVGATANELRAGWRVIVACGLGIGVGVIALPGAAVSIFMPGLQHDLGWSRTAISLGYSILTTVLVLLAPFVGWLCDRFAEKWLAAASFVAMGIAFALLSHLGPDIRVYLAGLGGLALVGACATTIPFARIVSANFARRRGTALGLAMVGNGITGLLLPLLLVPYVGAHGWRAGFNALALLVMVSAPVFVVLLRGTRTSHSPDAGSIAVGGLEGHTLVAAARTRTFWTLAVGFACVTLGITGLNLHFIAYLTESGLPPARVGAIAGSTGVAMIGVRVGTGLLVDRMFAPWVAAAMFGAAAVCLALLAALGPAVAPLGALAYGLAIGSEIDLIGYLVPRYFGLRAYGRIYGVLYAAVLSGGILSPLAFGYLVDQGQGYPRAMQFGAVSLTVAALLMLSLRRFPVGAILGTESVK